MKRKHKELLTDLGRNALNYVTVFATFLAFLWVSQQVLTMTPEPVECRCVCEAP